jgi:hypothetical protein
MAQMTEALCAEAMAHCERGVFPPLTVNEMQQLLYAWKDAERYRWLRAQGGWPESEAAMMGAKPEDFDSMIDDQMSYAREIGTLRDA